MSGRGERTNTIQSPHSRARFRRRSTSTVPNGRRPNACLRRTTASQSAYSSPDIQLAQ